MAVGSRSLWVASPGAMSQPPASLGRFLGHRSFVRSTTARWQEATDPQSTKGGSQRACHTRRTHTTASVVSKQWHCFRSRPCCGAAIRSRLFGMPARGPVVPFNAWQELSYSVGATDEWALMELECRTTPLVRDDSARSHLMGAHLG